MHIRVRARLQLVATGAHPAAASYDARTLGEVAELSAVPHAEPLRGPDGEGERPGVDRAPTAAALAAAAPELRARADGTMCEVDTRSEWQRLSHTEVPAAEGAFQLLLQVRAWRYAFAYARLAVCIRVCAPRWTY